MSEHQIRSGRLAELTYLREIERRAGQVFADYGMAAIADDEPPSIEALEKYCIANRLWVATDQTDKPFGYIIVDLIDECAHIEQVSVHPDFAGQKVGQSLIETVHAWAKQQGLNALTLTTFAEIPWNAPYYERLGFQTISATNLSPGLQRIRDEEHRQGLDQWPRVCMKRAIV